MKCNEKGCPYPARQDGICVKHLQDRTLEASTIGGSIPLCQEYALVEDYGRRGAGNGLGPGGGARHQRVEPWQVEL
jgi:hypothetical protein